MAQSFIDDATGSRFAQFFENPNAERLAQQMEEFKENAEKLGASLECEAKGESLEKVRKELREQFKKQLYDK